MHRTLRQISLTILAALLAPALALADGHGADLDRTVLPIPDPKRPLYDELDVRNVPPPEMFKVEAPKDAPNVLIVLVDDLGFAGTSTFGGPVPTPTFDALAQEGVFYNNFHTTAVCSPTRAALKLSLIHISEPTRQ